MLDLARHDGASDALGFKSVDEFRQLAQRKPVNGSGAFRLDLGESLFLDGGDHDFISLRPRRVQHQKRKLAIAGDETETCHSRNT